MEILSAMEEISQGSNVVMQSLLELKDDGQDIQEVFIHCLASRRPATDLRPDRRPYDRESTGYRGNSPSHARRDSSLVLVAEAVRRIANWSPCSRAGWTGTKSSAAPRHTPRRWPWGDSPSGLAASCLCLPGRLGFLSRIIHLVLAIARIGTWFEAPILASAEN